jgi:hypothetical protein
MSKIDEIIKEVCAWGGSFTDDDVCQYLEQLRTRCKLAEMLVVEYEKDAEYEPSDLIFLPAKLINLIKQIQEQK